MIYYTQLIYVQAGKEEIFHSYEDIVLPLLGKYGGSLILRVRPTPENVLAGSMETPYEVHLVSFPERQDFLEYMADETRRNALRMKEESVLRVVLVEGQSL